jgi:hypothetical protein
VKDKSAKTRNCRRHWMMTQRKQRYRQQWLIWIMHWSKNDRNEPRTWQSDFVIQKTPWNRLDGASLIKESRKTKQFPKATLAQGAQMQFKIFSYPPLTVSAMRLEGRLGYETEGRRLHASILSELLWSFPSAHAVILWPGAIWLSHLRINGTHACRAALQQFRRSWKMAQRMVCRKTKTAFLARYSWLTW